MSLKIKEVKEVDKDIKFMTNLDVEYVSFVQHGANKEPFRVIKTVKGGTMDNFAVQSLVLAVGVSLESLAEKSNLGWMTEISTENMEKKDAYSKITQIDPSQFDENTLQLLKLDEDGAWAIVGSLKKESDQKSAAVTVSEQQIKALKENASKSFFQQPVNNEDLTGGMWQVPSVTAGELFVDELWNMEDVLFAVLRQDGLDAKKRKRAVLDSIDAFKGFMSMLMDSVGDGDIKINKTRRDSKEEGGEDMGLFKTKEEFEAAVDERVKAIQEKSAGADDTKTAEEPAAPEAKTEPEAKADDTKADDGKGETPEAKTEPAPAEKSDETPAWAKTLTDTIESLKTRIEKMENSPESDPANSEETDADTKKSATTTQDVAAETVEADFEESINPKYKGKFSGLFGDLRG